MSTTQKKPCEQCATRVDHYSDGTIAKHKVYEYKEVNGKQVKTGKSSYCKKTRWYN